MPPIQPQSVQITCPSCSYQFQTQIHTIVDVTQQPELKQTLLSGQLNLAVCPNCGAATMLGTPLFYHDAQQQLFMTYIPQELNLDAKQEEGLIGEATSVLMSNLPPDTQRGHLFTPRRVMSLASLIDNILEADGIPREVLEQQRNRVELISLLAQALPEEQQFAALVEQHKAELTPEFFATIDAFIRTSEQEQQVESAQVLTVLRTRLAEMVGYSGSSLEQPVQDEATVKQAVEQLASASDEELTDMIAELRPVLDYGFFQAWTDHIDALRANGQTDEAERLTARRATILAEIERMDQEAQAIFESGATMLREVLSTDDPHAALRARADQIDDAFMLVLSSNITAAQRAGQNDLAALMDDLGKTAIEIIQERMTPEERLINQLMMTDTPQESTNLLRSNAAQVTPAFVKKINELADEQQQQGAKEHADRLRQLAREAGAMLF